MHIRVITRHEKAWPAPGNHLDGRVCACGITVHGWAGQRAHARYHEELAAERDAQQRIIIELMKRCGMAEEAVKLERDGWSWGAEITGIEEEIEAAE